MSPSTSYAGDYIWQGDDRSGCERILTDAKISRDEWQMGVTKAFIKNPETLFYLEGERDRYWHTMASRIQRAWRAHVRRKHEAATKIQRFWKNQKESLVYARKRDYGHEVLAGRKERRRFSLLGMRKFMGDYLDVGGSSPQGELLRNAAGLSRESEATILRQSLRISCRDGTFQFEGRAAHFEARSVKQAEPEVPHHRE